MTVSPRPLRRVSRSTSTPIVDVSVLVPAKDEAGNLALFLELCEATFRAESARYEVVVVDDGSTDGSWALLQQLRAQYPFLVPVRHRAQRGIAEALRTGYLQSHGRVPAHASECIEDEVRVLVVAEQKEVHRDADGQERAGTEEKRPTSNVQRPTLNVERPISDGAPSGFWTLDVRSRFPRVMPSAIA